MPLPTWNFWPFVLRSHLLAAQAEIDRLRCQVIQAERRAAQLEDERSRRAQETLALSLELVNSALSKSGARLVGDPGRAEMAVDAAQSQENNKPVWSATDQRVLERWMNNLVVENGMTKEEAFARYVEQYGYASPAETLVLG